MLAQTDLRSKTEQYKSRPRVLAARPLTFKRNFRNQTNKLLKPFNGLSPMWLGRLNINSKDPLSLAEKTDESPTILGG
jgi:hypothetical protein